MYNFGGWDIDHEEQFQLIYSNLKQFPDNKIKISTLYTRNFKKTRKKTFERATPLWFRFYFPKFIEKMNPDVVSFSLISNFAKKIYLVSQDVSFHNFKKISVHFPFFDTHFWSK